MSMKQEKKYMNHIIKKNHDILDPNEDFNNPFFIKSRIYSNIAYPMKRDVNGKLTQAAFTTKRIREKLKYYSTKFAKLITNIKQSRGTKSFIYSYFKNYAGIRSIVIILEAHGFKNYAKHGVGMKRYSLWTGDESQNYKNESRQIYNSTNNLDGSQIQIIIGSSAIKEGVNLFGVRNVHIVEPYWNKSRMDQIYGRSIRYCSHKDLPAKDRNVTVYVYISYCSQKNVKSVEEHIMEIAKQKDIISQRFLQAIKESSIDCRELTNMTSHKIENIKCDQ